jgi:hypothetical protein
MFRISRGFWRTGDLEVSYVLGGTAEPDDIEPVPGAVTIPDGQAYADVAITPVDEPRMEKAETVILTVVPGPSYAPGTPDSAVVTIAASDEVADDFDSGDASGGTGWNSPWSLSAGASIVRGLAHSGEYQLELTGTFAEAVRSADLSDAGDVKLSFYWRTHSFDVGDSAVIEVYDGSQWHEVYSVTGQQQDFIYHLAEIDLSAYSLGADFQLRISTSLVQPDDCFFVDDILISAL